MFGFKKKKEKKEKKEKKGEKEKVKSSKEDRTSSRFGRKDPGNAGKAAEDSKGNARKPSGTDKDGKSATSSFRENRKKSLANVASMQNLGNATGNATGNTGGDVASVISKTGSQVQENTSPKLTILNAPQLKDAPPADRPMIFQNHLILCKQTFDFTDPNSDMEEKEKKRVILLGLVDHANSAKEVFTEDIYPDVIAMLSANLFRDLPTIETGSGGDEEEPVLEPAWPHLQIVYEFLLRFVVSNDVDAKVAKKYISHSFIIQLLELFNSEDPREREYLKTILHRVYGKYMALRAFIRKAINNVFFRVMYETERHNGIGELLEILGSIINGFALPLKAEHKRFLVRALIPLHKIKIVANFHQQLAYCVTQFVEKDPRMAEPIILGLLRFWPYSSSPKQVLFLNELEDILELVQPSEFVRVIDPLFRRIGICLDSPHFQVAERTLFLWNNEYLVSLIAQNKKSILPLIIKPLVRNSEYHWNVTVNSLTSNVVKIFLEMDKNLYYECKEAMEKTERKEVETRKKREERWAQLEAQYGTELVTSV